MSELITIKGRVFGGKDVAKLINRAPGVYRKAILNWLYKERQSFVGDKKKDGLFRKKLYRLKTANGLGWSRKVVNVFSGRVHNDGTINATLKMGVNYTNKRKIHVILESLQERHTINSPRYMPIPVYGNVGRSQGLYKLFKRNVRSGDLIAVYKKNKAFYFDKTSKRLMFVGRKSIRVKKKYDFNRDWNRRLPSVKKRYAKTIERATIKAGKGK